MQGWERVTYTLSVRRPQPHNTNLYRQKEKGKNSRRLYIVGIKQLMAIKKSIGPALETSQSHTIEYGVSKIVLEGHWEKNKSHAVLRGSAAKRRINIPMCDQGLLLHLAAATVATQCIGNRAPHCRKVLQNGQDKTSKASPKKRSIMEHLPGPPQDTKSLRSCSENRANMLLKGHLGIKCHSCNRTHR